MFVLKDILQAEIVPRLGIKDVIQLKLANTELYELLTPRKINELCINKVLMRLKQIFEDKLDGFLSELCRSGAVVSGSFLIQCILDENWFEVEKSKLEIVGGEHLASDIDIYVSLTDKYESCPRGDIYHPTTQFETWFFENNFVYLQYHDTERYGDDVSKHIVFIRNFGFVKPGFKVPTTDIMDLDSKLDLNKPTIQVIDIDFHHSEDAYYLGKKSGEVEPEHSPSSIQNENIKEFIESSFDFDICKNVFGVKDNVPYLSIFRLDQIINKITTYKPIPNREGSSLKRANKYRKRGFTFFPH